MNYDQTDIARHYDQARTLTPEAMTTSLDAMMDAIAPERVRVILDVGCGTGRFAVPLHARFGARVVGLDPSRHMLAQAQQTIQHLAIQFLRAAAECLPLQGACADLAYLSMVYHHLHDAACVAQELSRVLRPDGYVCIRNSVVELLDTFVHLHYFAKTIAAERDHYFHSLPHSALRPVAAVVDIARRFHRQLPLAVATGSTQVSAEASLRAIGILAWFDAVISSHDAGRPKPAPDVFLVAAERIGVAPVHCVAFEDGGGRDARGRYSSLVTALWSRRAL